jgi:hypothetical protein
MCISSAFLKTWFFFSENIQIRIAVNDVNLVQSQGDIFNFNGDKERLQLKSETHKNA